MSSQSPASRPKRNSALASFYIDEDDFEDDSSSSNKPRKLSEDVFVISENYESDEKSPKKSELDDFGSKVNTKNVNKSTCKKQSMTKKTSTSASNTISKSNTKKLVISKSSKQSDEDDFELVVDDGIDKTDSKASRNEITFEDHENTVPTTALKHKKAALKNVKSPSAVLPVKSVIRTKIPSSIEKVRIPGQPSGTRRVGLSRSAPNRPLSPVKLKKLD